MNARIIIPVWGKKYLKRFNEGCLPALLSPGNLPHLAKHYDCELVVVTETALFDNVHNLSNISKLKQYASLKLVEIDDKISHPNYYGVTITYAFYRGFIDLGDDEKQTWCLFLNADFILAENSYKTLVKKMLAGERFIYAPSYCIVEEEVRPILDECCSKNNGVLSISHRDMAGIILDHMHFTVRAKITNWAMYQIDRVDQFYYLVNNDTLIGRQLPIAIVAFLPERIPTEPVTFWDYGIVSEVCPTSSLCILNDSDDFLMLELRGKETMRDQLRLGKMQISEIAQDLSIWTTKDQRDCGEFTLLVHRMEIPSNIEDSKLALENYYRSVMKLVSMSPRDHRKHYIWLGVLKLHNEWLIKQKLLKHSKIELNSSIKLRNARKDDHFSFVVFMSLVKRLIAESTKGIFYSDLSSARQSIFDFLREVYGIIFGRPPQVSSIHPYFNDLKAPAKYLNDFKKSNCTPSCSAISVWTIGDATFAPFLSSYVGKVFNLTPDAILAHSNLREVIEDEHISLCFLELNLREFSNFSAIHQCLRPFLSKGSKLIVFVRLRSGEKLLERDFELISNGLPSSDLGRLEMHGNWYSFQSIKLWGYAIKTAHRSKLFDLLFLPILIMLVIILNLCSSLFGTKKQFNSYNNYTTSLVLSVTVI